MQSNYGYDRDEIWPWFNLYELNPDVRYEGFVRLTPNEYASFKVTTKAALSWQERLKELTKR